MKATLSVMIKKSNQFYGPSKHGWLIKMIVIKVNLRATIKGNLILSTISVIINVSIRYQYFGGIVLPKKCSSNLINFSRFEVD